MIVKKTIFSEPKIELVFFDDMALLMESVMNDPYDDGDINLDDLTSGL